MALKHTSLFQEASQCAMMVWEKENIRITSLSFTHVGVESWELPWNVTIGKAITQRTSFENPVVWIWILSPPLLGIEKWANSFMSLCLGFFTCKMGIIISSSWSCHVSKELTHVKHSVKVKWKCWSLSCVQLCNPMDYSLPGSSVHGILQEEYWSGLPFLLPGGASWPRDQTHVSHIAGGFFTIWATREALRSDKVFLNLLAKD